MNPQNKTENSDNSMRMQAPAKEARPVKYEDRCK